MRKALFYPAIILLAASISTSALALDWTQLILDERGKAIPDWAQCPGENPASGKCDSPVTIGAIAANQLCAINQSRQAPPEQKALECQLGVAIMENPRLTPDGKQLSIVREAIGRHLSPLVIARGWAILDAAVK